MCLCELTANWLDEHGAHFSAQLHRKLTSGYQPSPEDNKHHFAEEDTVLIPKLRSAGYIAAAERVQQEHQYMLNTWVNKGLPVEQAYFDRHAKFEDECVRKLITLPRWAIVPKSR